MGAEAIYAFTIWKDWVLTRDVRQINSLDKPTLYLRYPFHSKKNDCGNASKMHTFQAKS